MTVRHVAGSLLVLAALGALARAGEPAASEPAEKSMGRCQQMMQKEKEDVAALESKTAAMNAAQGDARRSRLPGWLPHGRDAREYGGHDGQHHGARHHAARCAGPTERRHQAMTDRSRELHYPTGSLRGTGVRL